MEHNNWDLEISCCTELEIPQYCALFGPLWVWSLMDDHSSRYVDVDECQTSVNLCEHNCTNTLGSFECVCDEGFTLNEDLLNCDGMVLN